ncbi:MAG: diaminopimelate decarboxylase, partial [Thermomicrobiales bacterium]
VFDERTLRSRARSMRETFRGAYEPSKIVYAGKAYLSPALMHILVQEGIGLDVVSGGEIHAGLLAGVDPAEMVFHGNNKSRAELVEAVSAGVGLIAIDNEFEIRLVVEVADSLGTDVRVLLRLNPGVDPHTHDKMRTGATDSKFGFPVWDGQADRAADLVCASPRLSLVGYHAHVGSQILEAELVEQTIDAIMTFAARVFARHGVVPSIVIPGGGFGVADDASGDDVSIEDWADAASRAIARGCRRYGFASPLLMVEPGRAIIGPAGIALYEVGSRKSIPGVRTYVSVDGGMADNIRPALYGARYTAALANRDGAGEAVETITIAGKFCESGDVVIEDAVLPVLVPGDLLAVPMAGAYCLAMASNYNLTPRPAAVLVAEGRVRLIRRRESYEDILRSELVDWPVGSLHGQDCLSAGKGSL